MNLSVNSVLLLENHKRYIILKQVTYMDVQYYFAMAIDDNNKTIPTDIVFITYYSIESYIDIVTDEEIIKNLIKII